MRRLKWLMIVIGSAILVNATVQVYNDPLEVMRVIPITGPKDVRHTWSIHEADFVKYETPLVDAGILAAIAQTESGGDSWAQPPWSARLSSRWDRILAPLSTAFGLMQLTTPTMEHALRLCRTGAVFQESHREYCRSTFKTRIFPSGSIAMSSILLHYQLNKLLTKKQQSDRSKTLKTAAVVHLCGAGVAKRFVEQGFRGVKTCGTHSLSRYINKVQYFYRVVRDFRQSL